MSDTAPLEYPFRDPPAPGTTLEVAPGVHWLRMPLPFQLEHINLWLLEDGAGAELAAHHRERLAQLEAACSAAPRTANDLIEVLFQRKLDAHQLFFAMGETIAHLHYLRYAGRLERQVGADGVARFARAAQPLRAIA